MCHSHAAGRDHITAGRFAVCLWTSGKVRIFPVIVFEWLTIELRSTRSQLASSNCFYKYHPDKNPRRLVPVAVGAAWLSRGSEVNEP